MIVSDQVFYSSLFFGSLSTPWRLVAHFENHLLNANWHNVFFKKIKNVKKTTQISSAICLTAKSLICDFGEAAKPWQWIEKLKKNNQDEYVFLSNAAL